MDDIPAVMEVERQSFTMPWPAHAYRRELKENRLARYLVARRTGPPVGEEYNRRVLEASAPSSRPPGFKGILDRLMDALGKPPEATPQVSERARRVVGYAGLWLMVDEAHITAIAVAPAYRGLGVGDLLMLGVIDLSREIGAQYVTLEVRVSNTVAQNLYRKFTFKETGVRRRYYSDNNEDALIMWSDPLDSPGLLERLEENRRALIQRFSSSQIQAELRSRGAQA